MAKNTPKKTAQSKTEPMDATVGERTVGEVRPNTARTCHAIKQLVAEVTELFPETPVEYSDYDGRNTALGVTFDLTVHNSEEAEVLGQLIGLVETDERVNDVLVEDSTAYVGFKSSPRTQDSRDSFGLADTYEVLTEGDESNWVDAPDWQPTGWIGSGYGS